jgi:membrane associated rhomboid family serine protease
MRPPPSPLKFFRYPVTTGIIMLAVAATLQSWFRYIDPVFLSNTGNCLHEPWRLLTPVFFHGGPLHLLFNVFWLWTFGTVIERRFGHLAALGVCLLLAVGSVAAELALFRSALGLSGVVYGLFGLLWVLSVNDPRFEDAVDEKVVELMIGWFILCIVLKVADVWNIALVSHASGCILGALLGWTLTAGRLSHRIGRSAILFITFAFCLVGATVARERINLVKDYVALNSAKEGQVAWERGDTIEAIRQYKQAVDTNPAVYPWWDSLGAAYERAGRSSEARDAFRHSAELRSHHFFRPAAIGAD